MHDVAQREDAYRTAERRLWDQFELTAHEHFVDLPAPQLRLRVVEVGSGPPVLFIPGSGGTGPYWAPLVHSLPGYRCLLLDRPGWGLSSPLKYRHHDYGAVAADIVGAVLDRCGVHRAAVIGASIGNVWALRAASRHPARVSRAVLIGGAPLVPDMRLPLFIRLLASPLGAVMARVPEKPGMTRGQLRGLGHGASLDAGKLDGFIGWRTAFVRETSSMRNEREMVRAICTWHGMRPGLPLTDDNLAAINQPVLYLTGTADPVGSGDLAQRVAQQLPNGEVALINDAGHLPWWDAPQEVADNVKRFLPPS